MKPVNDESKLTELSDGISDEFITSDDPVFNHNMPPVYKGTVGDLHKEIPAPSADDGSKIREDVSTSSLKKESLSSKITEAVEKLKKTEKVPETPLDKLKSFIEFGSLTKEVEHFGSKWKFKTLDQADRIAMFDEADTMANYAGKMPAIALLTVVYSLEAIDGISVYKTFQDDIQIETFKGNKHAYVVAVRAALKQYMQAFPQNMIDTLYGEIAKLEDEQREALNQIKKS